MSKTDFTQLISNIPPRPYPTYDDLTYSDFLKNHLIPNTPLLLSKTHTGSWPCRTQWLEQSIPDLASSFPSSSSSRSTSKPNLHVLRTYANHLVPIANTLKRSFSEFDRTERPLGEVLDLWEKGEGEGLYVKDWHLFAELDAAGKGVGEVYEVPEIFRDDWLNPPYIPSPRPLHHSSQDHHSKPDDKAEEREDDFRFTYLGPAGTITPLHRDVYASYSWSANIVGRKLWWLFPPETVDSLKGRNGELPFDVRDLDGEGGGVKILQEEGEVIFVPSGWYHQVLNLDFCISINHNFLSSPTLPSIFKALSESQERVAESIQDIKEMIQSRLGEDEWEEEWMSEVQGLLERDAGWGWRGFWEMVRAKLMAPPAPPALSPSHESRDGFVREVVEQYKRRREWIILHDVRAIVEEVEGLLGPPT